MGRELWAYPAVVWASVAEFDYRRESIAADFKRTRRPDVSHRAAGARVRLPRQRAAEAAATDDVPSAPADSR